MELGLRFLSFIQIVIDYLLWPVYRWIERKQPRRIPFNDNPLLKISATKLAQKIRNKQLKSEDVVRAYIQRMQEVNPVVNAVVEDRYEAAIRDAIAVDQIIASSTRTEEQLEREMPLYGVPITIKESCGVEGMSQAGGSVPRVGVKAVADGEAVSRLRAAGAIPLAVTNTPELCLSWETDNLITGRTLNPYNTYRTSGGSSGGEGALIGAGASIGGVGSDIAGSIRVPSSFNGIFGHKPSGAIVSIKGHYPQTADEKFPEYLVLGPMTRYAEDLLTFLKIMVDDKSKLKLDSKVDLSTLNVFFMEDAGPSITIFPVQKEIKKTIIKSVTHLQDHCKAAISTTKFPEFGDSIEQGISVFFSVLHDVPNILLNPNNPKENNSIFIELFKSILGMSQFSLNALLFYILQETNVFIRRSNNKYHMKKFNEFHRKFEATLGENGVFLYPTFPTTAFNHYGLLTKTAGVMYTMIFNLMGLPSTNVPIGMSKDGLPLCIQVVAAKNQDRLCIAVAQELEKAFGGWVPPPTTPA